MGSYYPIPSEQWSENYVSISLRVIDVETGSLIYSGAGQFNAGLPNPRQEIATYIINEIIGKWVTSPGRCGFNYAGENKDNKVIITIIEVLPHSPADIAGVRVGDKILKVKDKDVANLSSIEFYSLTWGYPGEVMPLEVERDGEIIKFNIKRISTEEILNIERQRQQQPNPE